MHECTKKSKTILFSLRLSLVLLPSVLLLPYYVNYILPSQDFIHIPYSRHYNSTFCGMVGNLEVIITLKYGLNTME